MKHIIAVLVDNEFGALARIVSLFSGRGYNIESLTVSEVDTEKHLSRVTITTITSEHRLEQIKAHLEKLIPVHQVIDLTDKTNHIESELALIKVVCGGDDRGEALRIATIFKADAVDSTNNSFVFEVTGDADKIDSFIEVMKPLGLAEISRTGITAISRGNEISF